MKNVYVVNPEKFQEKKRKIIEQGVERLLVLSDFDRTLTRGLVEGRKTPSMISLLREDEKYLGEDYAKKAKMLAKKYRPIEFDPKIGQKEKKIAMTEWWSKHLGLLVEKKLNRKHLKTLVSDKNLKLRTRVKGVFKLLSDNRVPLIIISASGLGEEPILMFLEKEGQVYHNVFVVSNSFMWDKDGSAISYKDFFVHSLNKDKALSDKKDVLKRAKNRKNVLLLGDTMDDIRMADNLEYHNLIKICFLSDGKKGDLKKYKELYDVLIMNDSSMKFVEDFLKNFNN